MTNDAFRELLGELDAARTEHARRGSQIAELQKRIVAEFKSRGVKEFTVADENKALLDRKRSVKIDVDQFYEACAREGRTPEEINAAISRKVITKEAAQLLAGDTLKTLSKSKPGAFYVKFVGDRFASLKTGKPSTKRKAAV